MKEVFDGNRRSGGLGCAPHHPGEPAGGPSVHELQ